MASTLGDISRAIRKKYDDTAALNTLTSSTSAMFHGEAPRDFDMPYIVMTLVNSEHEHVLDPTPSTPYVKVHIQFSVFHDSESPSTTYSIMDQLEAAYGLDDSGLSFVDSSYQEIYKKQIGARVLREPGVYHGIAEYEMLFLKLAT